METRLGKVYNELYYTKKVKSRVDFGDQIGYNKGYISTILRSTAPISAEVSKRLTKTFGINRDWLENGDSSGVDMFGKPLNHTPVEEAQLNHEPDNPMLINLIKATMDQSAAARDQAAAMLLMARSNLMLTEVIQQRFGDASLKKAMAG